MVAKSQIQVAWQYDFDVSQTDNPTLEFSISQIRTSASNYCLAEYRASDGDTPVEQRLVFLDPAGNQLWMSENITTTYGLPLSSSFNDIEIQRVGAGSLTVGILSIFEESDLFASESILRFAQDASPQVLTLDLAPGEYLALQKVDPVQDFTYDVPASTSGENGFFTTGFLAESASAESIRRYLFSATPSLDIVTTAGVSSGSAVLVWEGEAGASYQVQRTTDLSDSESWVNLSGLISGNGATQTWASEIQSASAFFRLIQL